MAKKEPVAVTAAEQASYQKMADLAEGEMIRTATRGSALHGEGAAEHARAMLTAAGMDPTELNRLIGGRPNLDSEARPGAHSPLRGPVIRGLA